MPRRIHSILPAALLLVLAWPTLLKAQALADRVPADAILYMGWNGVESPGPGFQGSNLQAVLKNSKIPELCEQFMPRVFAAIGKQDQDAAAGLAMFQAVMGPMWRHPSAIAFNGIDGNAPNGPAPRLILICQAGADSADLKKQFENLIKMADGAPFPINVIQAGDLVALVVGYEKPETALVGGAGGNGGSLAADPHFTGALAHASKGAVLTSYADVEKFVALVDKFAPSAGMEVQDAWPKVRDALGIAGVKRVIGTEGFDGKEWASQLFIAAPEPRSCLIGSMLSGKPLGDEVFKVIPQNATLAGATFFDLNAFVSNIRAAVANFDPDTAKQIDGTLEQINQAIGMDVQKDLLASFGDQWAYWADPATFGNGLAGLTLVNRPRNPEKLEKSLTQLEDFINEQAAAALKGNEPQIHIAFRREKVGNVTIHFLGFPAVTPAWAIQNGNMYVALYPEVISAATARAAAGGKSLLDNPGFAALRQKLAAKQITSFDYADLPRLAPESYGTWLGISRLAGVGDLLGVSSPINILPPLDTLTANLGPSGQVTWTDADGFHMRGSTPFPGADLLVSDPSSMSIAQVSLMTSIMLPALNRSREMANRVKSASNLRQIGLGAMMFANGQRNGAFPKDMGELLKTQDLSIDVFINPRSSNAAPQGLTPQQQQQWVKENGDYVWNGAGKNNATPADVPIGWEKPQGLTDGINILFGDGHVDFVPMGKAMEMIQAAQQGNNPPAASGRAPPASRRPDAGL